MANFPPSNSPVFMRWERLADEYPIVRGPVFADGGIDTFLSNTTPIRRWRVIYEGLLVAEAAILDSWYASNSGEHGSFNFTDRDSTVYGGVKVDEGGYERGHGPQYEGFQFRRITFIDRP